MKIYRPLRFCLLFYEFIRLFTLLWVVRGAEPQEEVFPWLVYGSANALFLFMALFLLADMSRYRSYIPLYTAGKILAAFSAMGWVFFSRVQLTSAIIEGGPEILTLLGGVLGIAGADLLSAAGALALSRKLKDWKPPEIEAETVENGGL
jgi:hypothetical protein